MARRSARKPSRSSAVSGKFIAVMKSEIVTSAEGSGVSTSAKLGCSSFAGGGGAARAFSSRIEAKVAKALSAP